MGNQVYQDGNFKVYRAGHHFIVHNAQYPFVEKHTHVKSYKQALKLIKCARFREIPRSLSAYLLISLIRLTDDEEYTYKLEELVEVRKQKGLKPKYCNRSA